MPVEYIQAANLADIREGGIYKLPLNGEPLIITLTT